MKKSCSQQFFSGLCWGFGGTLSFAFSKSQKQRLGACSLSAKCAWCKVGSQGFVIAQCWGYHMAPPFFWAQFELVLCNSKSSAAQPRSFSQRGRRKEKMVRDFLPFHQGAAWQWKLLISHTWQSVFCSELYLQLNAVSFSGLFRPFRTSKGHLCCMDGSPSSVFLFSAYQTGVHFNIRRLIVFPLSDVAHELLNLSCTCLG